MRMVPGSTRNWIAANAVHKSKPWKRQTSLQLKRNRRISERKTTSRPQLLALALASWFVTFSPTATPAATPTPTPCQTPAAPTNLVATAISSSQIALSWTDNANNETGFQIQRSTNGVNFTLIATLGANVTTYTDNGLTAATTYYYRVRAFNASGNSAASNVASATTLPASTPTPTPTPSGTPVTGPLWYNGDFDNVNGLANERDTSLGSGQFASVYDNFNVTGTGGL